MRKFINKFLASRGYEVNKIGRTIYFLESLAKKQGEISFIQVGANDGISFDNIYPFFKSRKCKGLLIEPLPYFFDRLNSTTLTHQASFLLILPCTLQQKNLISIQSTQKSCINILIGCQVLHRLIKSI